MSNGNEKEKNENEKEKIENEKEKNKVVEDSIEYELNALKRRMKFNQCVL
jgi:hypothetical protein